MIKTKKVVYDLEQFKNFHSCAYLDLETKKEGYFVIHDDINDIKKYVEFLENLTLMVGFNNLNFDYQLVHYILENKDYLVNLNSQEINRLLYDFTQNEVINAQYPPYSIYKCLIDQIDLFRIHHFDNKARSTSLKKLEVNMKMSKVEDLPFKHYSLIKKEDVPKIIEYNLHDVKATYLFLIKSKSEIELRKSLSDLFNINLINSSGVKIGEKILLKKISSKLKVQAHELKERAKSNLNKTININEILIP
jgi:hypothetical protein